MKKDTIVPALIFGNDYIIIYLFLIPFFPPFFPPFFKRSIMNIGNIDHQISNKCNTKNPLDLVHYILSFFLDAFGCARKSLLILNCDK